MDLYKQKVIYSFYQILVRKYNTILRLRQLVCMLLSKNKTKTHTYTRIHNNNTTAESVCEHLATANMYCQIS